MGDPGIAVRHGPSGGHRRQRRFRSQAALRRARHRSARRGRPRGAHGNRRVGAVARSRRTARTDDARSRHRRDRLTCVQRIPHPGRGQDGDRGPADVLGGRGRRVRCRLRQAGARLVHGVRTRGRPRDRDRRARRARRWCQSGDRWTSGRPRSPAGPRSVLQVVPGGCGGRRSTTTFTR